VSEKRQLSVTAKALQTLQWKTESQGKESLKRKAFRRPR